MEKPALRGLFVEVLSHFGCPRDRAAAGTSSSQNDGSSCAKIETRPPRRSSSQSDVATFERQKQHPDRIPAAGVG
jgi:hypothetical protein